MSFVDYINQFTPSNIPDLLNIHHNNPIGIPIIAQLLIIFVLVEVMGVFDYKIRNKGKSQYYPVLYVLLAVSLISIYYYCFQSVECFQAAIPKLKVIEDPYAIGWFCQHQIVGWGWVVVGVLALIHVIYTLLCAVMQVTAEMSVHANLVEGKKWKEWKWAMFIALVGVAICGCIYFVTQKYSTLSWAFVTMLAVLLLFIIGKMIADCIRSKSVLWGVSIALVFLIGMLAVIMTTVECMRGVSICFVVILAYLTMAKASKKQQKEVKPESTVTE